MNAADVAAQANRVGRKADQSDALDHAVRVGLMAYGAVHLLIAWLALQLAFGERSGSPDQQGALAQLAQTSFGDVVLWVVGVGFFALVAWQALEAIGGHRGESGGKRVYRRLASAGKAIVYGALGVSALKIAIGSGSGSGGDDTDTMTARLMSLPFGVLLVGLVGVVIAVIAFTHVYKGFASDFRDHLDVEGQIGLGSRLYIVLGTVGYLSKGAALLAVAALFGYAAWTHDPNKSGGLDQALKAVLEQPFGMPVLVLIALGLACFGLFCFAWARHLDR